MLNDIKYGDVPWPLINSICTNKPIQNSANMLLELDRGWIVVAAKGMEKTKVQPQERKIFEAHY